MEAIVLVDPDLFKQNGSNLQDGRSNFDFFSGSLDFRCEFSGECVCVRVRVRVCDCIYNDVTFPKYPS